MRKLKPNHKDYRFAYLDVSYSHPLIVETLREMHVREYFFNHRDVPVNAVIGGRENKIGLKGPMLGRVEPNNREMEGAAHLIGSSNALLINSVKDQKYVEHYIKIAKSKGIPIYAVITSALDPDFIFKVVIPNTKPLFNYDEMPNLYGVPIMENDREKMEFAIEKIKEMRMNEINKQDPLIVTLGSHGAYYTKKESIGHVMLTPPYSTKVNKSVRKNNGHTSGAGDIFAGAYTLLDALTSCRADLDWLMIKASVASIRHIGYKGKLPGAAFSIEKYQIS